LKERKKSSTDFLIKKSSAFGEEAEEFACRYLKSKGYYILERNYSCRFGEIDIIAKDAKTICFIEVKARTNISFGPPFIFVTAQKQSRIKKTALFFIATRKLSSLNYRFDVVSIVKNKKGSFEVELIKGAFE